MVTLTKIKDSAILAVCFVDKVELNKKEVHTVLVNIFETTTFRDLF